MANTGPSSTASTHAHSPVCVSMATGSGLTRCAGGVSRSIGACSHGCGQDTSANGRGGRVVAAGRRSASCWMTGPSARPGAASWANWTIRFDGTSIARRGSDSCNPSGLLAPTMAYSLASASWNTKRRSMFMPRRLVTTRGNPVRTTWMRTPTASFISVVNGPSRLLTAPSVDISRRSVPLTRSTSCGGRSPVTSACSQMFELPVAAIATLRSAATSMRWRTMRSASASFLIAMPPQWGRVSSGARPRPSRSMP